MAKILIWGFTGGTHTLAEAAGGRNRPRAGSDAGEPPPRHASGRPVLGRSVLAGRQGNGSRFRPEARKEFGRRPKKPLSRDIRPPMSLLKRARAFIGLADPCPKWPPDRLSLALQGGGSFGAFTWGVLDRLLEEPGNRLRRDQRRQRRRRQRGSDGGRNGRRRAGRGAGASDPVLAPDEPGGGAAAETGRLPVRGRPRTRDPLAVALSVQPVQPQSAARGAPGVGRFRTPARPLGDQAPACARPGSATAA